MTSPTAHTLKLGAQIRALRLARGLDLADVARVSTLDPRHLERIEADDEEPAIGELSNLANALGVSLGSFFQTSLPESRVEVVHAHERWTVEPQSDAARALNYRYQALSYRLTEKHMAPFLVEVPPHEGRDAPTSSHAGEEFGFVLAGQLEINVGGTTYRLGPGDAIYFDSQQPHTFRAVEGTTVRLLVCILQARRPPAASVLDRSFD
jgi:transcriptional regulator with XRE-family HTH domain